MEAGTRDSAQHVSTAEEESLKRNTDCVYFLASPLTCKKGSECEYRHSEAARINPRDCWYWINGNCLNPKCAFRHPPLDGLIGTPGTPSVGLSVPPSQSVAPKMPPSHTPANSSGKPAVPCYYFQKGLCLKGDRCAFLHGAQPLSNPPPQQQETKAVTNVSEPFNPKKTYGSLDKSNQQQTTGENFRKSTEVPPQPKLVMKPEMSPSEVSIMRRNILPPITSVDERQKHMMTNASPNASGNSVPRPHHSLQAQAFDDRVLQDGKDADESLRESSPGFDVLVDDELRDPDYYHAEDEYRRTASHEGRRLNSLNEFDYDHSVNYAPLAKFDREPYDDPHGFDSYGKLQDQYAREQQRVLSDWTERPSMLEKRGFSRVEKPNQIDESDLRQRLSKQRRVNGLRSVVSPDHRGDVRRRDDHDRHSHDQRNRGYSSRDSHHIPHESSRSNRLQGRLSLPRRSSPDRSRNDSRLERDVDGGMSHSRLSPGRPPTSFLQGRQEGRIRRPGHDDFRESRDIRGNRRDEVDGDTSSFAGPKRLAELKGTKFSGSTEARLVKARQVSQPKEQKNLRLGPLMSYQESEGSIHFEGPKPLSEILKRKRGAETASSRNGTASENGQVDSPKESGEIVPGSPRMSAEKEANDHTRGMKEDQRSLDAGPDIATEDNEEGQVTTEGYDVVPQGEISDARKGTELESEDGMMVDDAMGDQEDPEHENYDQRDEEYDYEPTDGGNDENVDEEEYLDDEDGDDFAKKIGVMFS